MAESKFDDDIKPNAGEHQELLNDDSEKTGSQYMLLESVNMPGIPFHSLHTSALFHEMERYKTPEPELLGLPGKPTMGYETAERCRPTTENVSPPAQATSSPTAHSGSSRNVPDLSVLNSSNTNHNVPDLSVLNSSETNHNVPVIPSIMGASVTSTSASKSSHLLVGDSGLCLRGYQFEISKWILKGENDIIILPTGTGKTLVAINLMVKHLKKNPKGKILFTTPNRVIAEQQTERVKMWMSNRNVDKVVGGDLLEGSPQLRELLEGREPQIVILTPQLVVNYMLAYPESSSLEYFSLIIIDECHSGAAPNNPTRNLLDYYHETILNGVHGSVAAEDIRKRLPQLVGLTATIGTGSKKTKIAAKEHIEGICARFDLKHPPTEVVECKEELDQFTAKPSKYVKTVISAQDNKEFIGKLSSIIKQLFIYLREQLLSTDVEVLKSLGRKVDPMRTTGYNALLSRCKEYFDAIVAQHDHQAIPEAMNSIKALKQIKIYATTRYLAEMSECKTALKHLVNCMEEPDRGREIQNIAPYDQYTSKWKRELMEIAQHEDERQSNHKLEVLKETLQEIFDREPSSQIMVFAERRDLCKILTEWIDDLDKIYKPRYFISSRDSYRSGESMTSSEQSEVMENFREKNLNILVSTSIGELGLDIPDCNATITYMNITDYISGKQVAGRSRDLEGSAYYILSAIDVKRLQDFDVEERRQNEALDSVRALNDDEFRIRMETLQRAIHADIMLKRKKEEDDRLNKPHDTEIICNQCGHQLSNLSKIKNYLQVTYLVIDGNLNGKLYCIRGSQDEGFVLDDMRAIGRMYCKWQNCNNHVGKVFVMDGHYLPRWKLEKVRLVGVTTRCDKWATIRKSFYVQKISYDELTALLIEAADVEVREPNGEQMDPLREGHHDWESY